MPLAPVSKPKLDPKHACYRLRIGPSKIHRYGVYAEENIPANRKVIEYTGERLNRKETKARDRGKYTYLFAVDNYWTLDGAVGGSGAEIINHSCEPNLFARILKGHILYMALRPIKRGEELTIDYNFDIVGDTSPCSCGARKCRGIMEKKKERERPKKSAKKSKNSKKKATAKTGAKTKAKSKR
ncbi:MAG: SET domain-containing protein-lysine N-methyltransferase [Bryobacteraceae bacterium]